MPRPRGSGQTTAEQRAARGRARPEREAELESRPKLGGAPIDPEEPPIPLSEGEHRMYRLLVASLHPGTSSEADSLALALAAQIGARVHGLEREEGEKLPASLIAQYFKLLQDYGLTPRSRLGLATAPKDKPPGGGPTLEDFYAELRDGSTPPSGNA